MLSRRITTLFGSLRRPNLQTLRLRTHEVDSNTRTVAGHAMAVVYCRRSTNAWQYVRREGAHRCRYGLSTVVTRSSRQGPPDRRQARRHEPLPRW